MSRDGWSVARMACLFGALAVVCACEDGIGPPRFGGLDGLWDFTGTRTGFGGVCSDSGSIRFENVGPVFAGQAEHTVHCDIGGTPFDFVELDSIRNATVTDTVVTFEVVTSSGGFLVCKDTVHIQIATDRLAGRGTCGINTVAFAAVRGEPVSTVAVTPPAAQRVTGAFVDLTAVLRTASGLRIFLRPIAWSTSNAAVATVSALGRVSTVAAGSATITATAENHSASATISVPTPAGFPAIGAGNALTCALDAGGAPYCWGAMAGTRGLFPAPVAGGFTFTALSVGHDFACGLTAAGKAWCWGSDEDGQLGDGNSSFTWLQTPVPVAGNLTFTSLRAGGRHACGFTTGGAAVCWGANDFGQLGINDTTPRLQPVPIGGSVTFVSLAPGASHTCGLTAAGQAYCWGMNAFGAVGDSTTTRRLAPIPVATALKFTALSAGTYHSCGLAAGGAAYCWGPGQYIGTGGAYSPSVLVPVAVPGAPAFTTIAAGGNHNCGLTAAGAVWCWGANYYGQLGNGMAGASSGPVAVQGVLSFMSISLGVYNYSDEATNGGTAEHTCAVTTGGLSYCWGVNNIGQVGNGTSNWYGTLSPAKVAGQP